MGTVGGPFTFLLESKINRLATFGGRFGATFACRIPKS